MKKEPGVQAFMLASMMVQLEAEKKARKKGGDFEDG